MTSPKERTFNGLMTRLSRAGFKREFVASAILPDWWDDECSRDAAVLPEIELRIARFLRVPLADVMEPRTSLRPRYPHAQLRHNRSTDLHRLGPAVHAAVAIAGAVVRSLRKPGTAVIPPLDGLEWREGIARSQPGVTLDDICRDLWSRCIPVVPVEVLPAPKFQGAACVVEGHPVVLIGHKNDEPARVAFLAAHEVGHITAGDCAPDRPVVDGEEVTDRSQMEQNADRYARLVLTGSETSPELQGGDFRRLAREAAKLERDTGAEASSIIFSWAARTGDYPTAARAARALYRSTGARRMLRQYFDSHVDFDAASETDRALLRCVIRESGQLAAAG